MNTHVVIVGGGIAGLSTAYALQKQAEAAGLPLRLTLVEADNRLGGKIITRRRDGFVIEGGPDSFITQKPEAVALCRELGLGDQLIGTSEAARRVLIVQRRRLLEMPEGVRLVVPTRLWPFAVSPLISWPGKLRMAMDLFIPPRTDDGDESLADFLRRRLGQEALEKLGEPMMAGIHVADAERLSLLATFPRFRDIEKKHGSLIMGMLAARRQAPSTRNGKRPSIFVTLRDGLDGLIEALTRAFRGEVMLGTRLVELRHRPAGDPRFTLHCDDGRVLHADAVILASPARDSARLLAPWPELAGELAQIRYLSTATLSLAFERAAFEHPLDGSGFVIPRRERRTMLACTWTSTKFAGRAPTDGVLLRAFIGGPDGEAAALADEADLVAAVREELAELMGVRAVPLFHELFRWPHANPQYDVGHLRRVDQIEQMAAAILPGLFLTGSAYRGVGIPDCVAQGQQAAEKALEYVGRLILTHG
jgi:oxygen-dependent protoporphyrinogen oxidase